MKHLKPYNQFINESWWTDLTNWFTGSSSSSSGSVETPIKADEAPYKIKNSDHLKECLEKLANSNQAKIKPTTITDAQAIQTALVLAGYLTEYQVDGRGSTTEAALNKFAAAEGISEKSESDSVSREALVRLIKKIWV